MNCRECAGVCRKEGKQKNGKQKYRCRVCGKYQQNEYRKTIEDRDIVNLLKEGCGIRSIGRLLSISPSTVVRRIRAIAGTIKKPAVKKNQEYELDEISTYVKKKERRKWIVYALRKDTGEVIDFEVGSRTKQTISKVVDYVLFFYPKRLFTDKLNIYPALIPSEIHQTKKYAINRIERKNLTLRTHLKRLNRKTICYSKSAIMLMCCLKIYFWG